jgi:hypothetical protein
MFEKDREKGAKRSYPTTFLEPFWSHFPSQIHLKIDAKIDAEKT